MKNSWGLANRRALPMNVKLIHLRMTRLQDLGKRERDRARNVKEALLPVLEQVPDSNSEKSDKEYDNN